MKARNSGKPIQRKWVQTHQFQVTKVCCILYAKSLVEISRNRKPLKWTREYQKILSSKSVLEKLFSFMKLKSQSKCISQVLVIVLSLNHTLNSSVYVTAETVVVINKLCRTEILNSKLTFDKKLVLSQLFRGLHVNQQQTFIRG